jgi:PKD repeat protein
VAVTAFQLDNGSSDNCTVVNFTPSSVSYTCADAGMQQVTLTVSDNSGHTASCTSTVTVEDSANPIALCNNLTVSLDESGTATVAASQIDNGSLRRMYTAVVTHPDAIGGGLKLRQYRIAHHHPRCYR